MIDPGVSANLRQELRRGSLVLACLLALQREPDYGYALLKTLAAAGVETDANTLYPLLRRLEKQGLLESVWVTEEPRPRRFYRVSDAGAEAADGLVNDWTAIWTALQKFQEGSGS
ncbi:MAG TPA: PadR family transcriptional regulator [Aeromicrobium sp.]|nr:PadR family transcriptional regulator [Aeromicrobium sp.]